MIRNLAKTPTASITPPLSPEALLVGATAGASFSESVEGATASKTAPAPEPTPLLLAAMTTTTSFSPFSQLFCIPLMK